MESFSDRVSKKKKKRKKNPWAICHSTLPDNVSDEKFERCVQKVKKSSRVERLARFLISSEENYFIGWSHFLGKLNDFLNEKVRKVGKEDLDFVVFKGTPTRTIAHLHVYLEEDSQWEHDPQKLFAATKYFIESHGLQIVKQEKDDLFSGSIVLTVKGLNIYQHEPLSPQPPYVRDMLESGSIVDVNQIGFEVEPGVFRLNEFIRNVEYYDTKDSQWICSIGKSHDTGEIFAAHDTRFYDDPDFECIFLK